MIFLPFEPPKSWFACALHVWPYLDVVDAAHAGHSLDDDSALPNLIKIALLKIQAVASTDPVRMRMVLIDIKASKIGLICFQMPLNPE